MLRNFFTKQSKGMILARIAVAIPLSFGAIFLAGEYWKKRSIESFEKWQQERVEIKNEAQRRHSEKQKTETGESPKALPAQLPMDRVNGSTADMPPALPTTEKHESVEVVTSGPLKGMEVEAAKAFANQQFADAKAAAAKRQEWELRRKALSQRRSKNIKQTVALAELSSKSVDDELATMLSVFKLMSEDQLEQMRQELLKTEPADKVNAFFNDLANASTKTPEQIQRDAEEILKSHEAYKTARWELQVEWEQIMLEDAELERTKPF